MKKKIILMIVFILIIILLLVGLYFYGLTSVSKKSEKVTFTASGGALKVASDLYEAKLIKSKIASNIYVRLHKMTLKAGTYELDRNMSVKEIFEIISDSSNSKQDTVYVTFIEGKKLTDYVKVISENFSYSEDEILSVLSDQEYLKELINKYDFLSEDILNSDIYYPLEGYLYPDTYEYYKDASIKSIFEKMLDKMAKVLDNYDVSIKETGKNIHEILTIASIIESESMMDEDRSIVSQVIYKRLNMNMSLGMDVTTYYGVKKSLKETLTQSDLDNNNPYNTRITSFIGLPVGPICNPSLKSIEAALNPSDTDYVYFYADVKTGKLYFAKTYDEFQELIRKYS